MEKYIYIGVPILLFYFNIFCFSLLFFEMKLFKFVFKNQLNSDVDYIGLNLSPLKFNSNTKIMFITFIS